MTLKKLFTEGGDLHDFFQTKKTEIKHEIEELSSEAILGKEDEVYDNLIAKYRYESINIDEEGKSIGKAQDVDIDVSRNPRYVGNSAKGTSIPITVPIIGSIELLRYRPSKWSRNPPRAMIEGENVVFVYSDVDLTKEKVKQNFREDINKFEKYIEWINNDVEKYNNSIEKVIRDRIIRRKSKILSDKDLGESLREEL